MIDEDYCPTCSEDPCACEPDYSDPESEPDQFGFCRNEWCVMNYAYHFHPSECYSVESAEAWAEGLRKKVGA